MSRVTLLSAFPLVAFLAVSSPSLADDQSDSTSLDLAKQLQAIEQKLDALTEEVRLLRGQHSFDPIEISFADLDHSRFSSSKDLSPDDVQQLPPEITRFANRLVTIRGFMFPPFKETGIAKFVLAVDLPVTNFGREPNVSDLIVVDLKQGSVTNYRPNQKRQVTGVLRIEPRVEAGQVVELYRLVRAQVD